MVTMTDEVMEAVIEELKEEKPVKAKKNPPVMRFSVMQEQLQRAITIVAKALDSRPTLPVLANILIETDDDRVRLSGTNLECSIQIYIGAKIDIPGSITLPAKTLTDVVSKLSPERIDFSLDLDTQTVTMKCGSSKNTIKGISSTEYPPLPVAPAKADIFIDGGVFKKMVNQSSYSSASEDNRPILTGLNFQVDTKTLTLAGADGYRLAVRVGPLNEETNYSAPIRSLKLGDKRLVGAILAGNVSYTSNTSQTIVLGKAGEVITKEMIKKFEESAHVNEVRISPIWLTDVHVDPACTIPSASLSIVEKIIDAKNPKELMITMPGEREIMFFEYDGITVATQLLDGKFPDFNALIPAGWNTSITVYTNDLLQAFKRAEVFARDSNNSVRLTAKPQTSPGAPGEVQVIGKSAERGENEGFIDAAIEGEEVTFAVNSKYVIETLAHIPEERVQLTTNGAAHPIVIRPEGVDNYLVIVMPMAINR